MAVITVTKENFEELAGAQLPLLVDFGAPWCGYCRRISPVVEQLDRDLEGKVTVGKVDIDEQPQLAERFDVETIPTLLLFTAGQAGEALIAPGSKAQIMDWLRSGGASV